MIKMNYLIRLFRQVEQIELTDRENEILQYPQKLKQYLVKRKYNLSILLILLIIELSYLLYDFFTNVDKIREYLTPESATKYIAIAITIIFQIVAEVGLVCQAIYDWNTYLKSSKFTLLYLFLKIVGSLLLLFIPYKDIIVSSSQTNVVNVALIVYEIFYRNIPSVLLVQSIIIQSNVLATIFKMTIEFKTIRCVASLIYLPIFLVITGLLFQIYSSNYLLGFVIAYLIFILLSLIPDDAGIISVDRRSLEKIRLLFIIIAITFLINVWYETKVFNIMTLLITFLIRYIQLSEGVKDLLICVVIPYWIPQHIMRRDVEEIRGLIVTNEEEIPLREL